MNLLVVFLTGLTTGGISCLAVQGGLLAGLLTNQQKEKNLESDDQTAIGKVSGWKQMKTLIIFLITKLVIHTLFGGFLGILGTAFAPNQTVRIIFQALTALFILATAANLLNLHPIFRLVAFQPPAWLRRKIYHSSKSADWFAPILLGLMTIFIPCGVTQSMEVLAISSASWIIGAGTMAAFVLGTIPLFVIIGFVATKVTQTMSQQLNKATAIILIIMGLYSLNGVLVVLDSPFTLQKVFQPITYFFSNERFSGEPKTVKNEGDENNADVQKIAIQITNNGYQPRKLTVKAGKPVELTVSTKNTYSCATAFTFRQFGINQQLGPNDSQTFKFIPTKIGSYTYACSMGMYTGTMEVAE